MERTCTLGFELQVLRRIPGHAAILAGKAARPRGETGAGRVWESASAHAAEPVRRHDVHARELHDRTGVRRMDDLVAADKDADVSQSVVEHQIARSQVTATDVSDGAPL